MQQVIEKREELAVATARQIDGEIAADRAKRDETRAGFIADANDRRAKALQNQADLDKQTAKAR